MVEPYCIVCGLDLPYSGRGRPPKYCTEHKVSKGADVKVKKSRFANDENRQFNKNSKRSHQREQYSVDLRRAGIDKIQPGRCIAILGDLQNGRNDQIQLLMEIGMIKDASQILSFCDGITLDEKEEARSKNKKNRKRYPEGTFIDGNMVDYHSLINSVCDVVDYDACSSLMPTSRATKELPRLFGLITAPVLQVNVLVKGWGVPELRLCEDDLKVMRQMPGYQDWEHVWSRTYDSISDDGKGHTWTYRTYTFRRL